LRIWTLHKPITAWAAVWQTPDTDSKLEDPAGHPVRAGSVEPKIPQAAAEKLLPEFLHRAMELPIAQPRKNHPMAACGSRR
jgi:hypothetical protein